MNNLSGQVWKSGVATLTATSMEEQKKMSNEEVVILLTELIGQTQVLLQSYNGLYRVYKDSDLFSVITRLEQNEKQLKSIKQGLLNE